tara:strand:- start:3210 stop:3647 length:438 start_codon:yes stop_codon:yes gene_type:complete
MNEINISCNFVKYPINKKNLRLFCSEILGSKGYSIYTVSIIFVNKDELKRMKYKYFKKNIYTDIIAFNLNEKNEELDGELYISYNYVKNNAKFYKTDFEKELRRVVSHGLLHLIGYKDDTTESKLEMTNLEDFFMDFSKNKQILC